MTSRASGSRSGCVPTRSFPATPPPPGGPQYTAATMGGGPGGAGRRRRGGRRFLNTKSQIYFLDPDGMNIGWQTGTGPSGERIYLPASSPSRPAITSAGLHLPPEADRTSRAARRRPCTRRSRSPRRPRPTDAYLTHNPIPVQFTAEDFDQVVDGGNFVTKVIYLPDPKYQELAVAGRRDPGLDPAGAGRRPDPRGRQAGDDPADRPARCDRPGDAECRGRRGAW